MIVNLPQAQGSITLTGTAADPQVVTALQSPQPVSIVTQLHGNGVVEVQVIDDATATCCSAANCASVPRAEIFSSDANFRRHRPVIEVVAQ